MFKDDYTEQIINDRLSKDEFLKNSSQSPIPADDRKEFKGLNYFEPDLKYKFHIELMEFPEKYEITIKDSKGNDRHFLRWGKFEFSVNGVQNELTAYKSDPEDTRLFIPFKDLTTAKETYGAGRYIDITEEDDKCCDKWNLDFNLAYNPWCAYNYNYSCPLVPEENILKIEIRVGEKKLKQV